MEVVDDVWWIDAKLWSLRLELLGIMVTKNNQYDEKCCNKEYCAKQLENLKESWTGHFWK